MMMEKDGWLSLTASQGNQNKPRNHHPIIERDRRRIKILDMKRARRSQKQTRGKKFSSSTYLNRSCFLTRLH